VAGIVVLAIRRVVLGDVQGKLATLLRRAVANDGMLDDNGVALLAASLDDLRQLGEARATG